MAPRAFICGLSGLVLDEGERAFLRDAQPWGVILFRRNVETPDQIRGLCQSVRETVQRDVPILIDQEGGRVQRVGPPHLPAYPPGATYGEIYRRNPLLGVEAAMLGARLIATDLSELGITIDCLPVLDVPAPDGDNVIGDRALGRDVDAVTTLGVAQVQGLLAGGVLPVMKHAPGHGRATADSHKELPRVTASLHDLDASDFVPFRMLARSVPFCMTAHVVFSAVDDSAPATLSTEVVGKIIRKRIGFDGALMTDDISMGALSGSIESRADTAIRAGCDLILHCNGDLREAWEVATAVPELEGDALRRTEEGLARRQPIEDGDRGMLIARFEGLVARALAA